MVGRRRVSWPLHVDGCKDRPSLGRSYFGDVPGKGVGTVIEREVRFEVGEQIDLPDFKGNVSRGRERSRGIVAGPL